MIINQAKAKKYKLTLAQLTKLAKLRVGCWICGRTKRADGKPCLLMVDHDHKTSRVRGILCWFCNKFLVGRHRQGEMLIKAATYLDSGFDARRI
jgi:hypothetical protein